MNPFFQICLKIKCNSTTKIGNLTSLFFIYTGITPLEWKQTIKDKKPIIMPLFPLFQVIFGKHPDALSAKSRGYETRALTSYSKLTPE